MNHLHFGTINSTQIFLKENIDQLITTDQNILVSCNEQTRGIGRNENVWEHQENSLAMSFSFTPNKILSLTTIEVATLIIHFFKEKYQQEIFLKWPNDLMDKNGKKLGGIITHYYTPTTLIVGLGINLHHNSNQDHFRFPISSLQINIQDIKSFAGDIYQYLITHRISHAEIISTFNRQCIHLNKSIQTFDGNHTIKGKCLGINDQGALLIETDEGKKVEIISGTIDLMN